MLGDQALERFLTLQLADEWMPVLDIGSGAGEQAEILKRDGWLVHTIDPNGEANIKDEYPRGWRRETGSIWCCHVLEHQLDIGGFLNALWIDLVRSGWLAITVPPARPNVVPGHVTQWSAGLLLYNLVLAGFDCSRAMVKTYGYNISVIVQKGKHTGALVTDTLNDLAHLFPVQLTCNRPEIGELPGDIESVNWD